MRGSSCSLLDALEWRAQGGSVLLGEEKVARSVGKRRESVGLERKCRVEVCGGCGACSGHVRFLSASQIIQLLLAPPLRIISPPLIIKTLPLIIWWPLLLAPLTIKRPP